MIVARTTPAPNGQHLSGSNHRRTETVGMGVEPVTSAEMTDEAVRSATGDQRVSER